MEELKKRENEDNYEYVKRLIDGKFKDKTLSEYDYVEIYRNIFDVDISSCESRKRLYGIRDLFDKFGLNRVVRSSHADDIEKLEELRKDIDSKTIILRDQRRELKKYDREDARFRHICELISEEATRIAEEKPFLSKEKVAKEKLDSRNEAVLIVSDWHIGSEFKNAKAEYNIEIAKRRAEDLLYKTIEYCKLNNVGVLHVESLGDNINGGIHWGSKVEAEEDCLSEMFTFDEMFAEFLDKLSESIDCVKVYSVIGNHGRINMNKKDNQKGENLERILFHYLKPRMKNNKKVELMECANIDEGIIQLEVKGLNIFGVHGDLDKIDKVADNFIRMFRIIPDEIHMGHFHSDYECTESDISVIVNGSLQGTDNYAFSIRKSGSPMQKLSIYDDEGHLCTYKIKLK